MTSTINIRNLVIAIALAVVAVLLTVVYVGAARDDQAAGKEQLTVYAVTKSFDSGASGAKVASNVTTHVVSRDAAGPDPVTNVNQIRGLFLTEPVYAGEQLTLKRFAPPAQVGVLAKISGNERAFQLPGTPNQLMVDTIQAGNRVDVVANLKNPKNQSDVKSAVVLRNLRVLDTVKLDDKSALAGSEGRDAVILAVTDEQAQRLYYVQKNGDWALQLRPVKKPKDGKRDAATFTTVLAGGAK
jgi:Flp pilus assembly protein CpaB